MTVHFVGSGPGAADLLTMRAVAMLRAAEVVLYAGTYLDEEVLSQCADDAELIDTQHLDLDGITAHLVDAHRRGLDTVRLCSGDPSLYSALTEQARRLDAAGVPWDVTPGVPAYAAAAAALGTELTVPELAQTIVLTRTQARSTAMPATESLGKVAGIRASLVLHLAITRTRVLADELSVEYGADCPCAVVAFASRPNQVVLRGTLADIADLVEEAGLKHTAVILVGRALGIREQPGVACSHLYDPARDRTT
ncbi:MAG: SAM-dependent methyltransferase [Rhodococcus sp. (in: high G+C Gram-positive bacteria)]|uniref:cobalt-precorrin-4/precorrin-4 C(11)-methyltransferase n=1 Tax=Rhodococcus sp. TaxID=1831 RepID=UPI003BB79A23